MLHILVIYYFDYCKYYNTLKANWQQYLEDPNTFNLEYMRQTNYTGKNITETKKRFQLMHMLYIKYL